jgi:signal peptidase II
MDRRARVAIITLVLVLLIDQASKIWVKTHMYLDQSFEVFPHWFYIHFIENPGMAFGLELGGDWGKLALSLFRIAAIVFIAYFLRKQIRLQAPMGLIVALSLVLAGATGNIIDSAFYGIIFSESPRYMPQVAVMFPPEGGYAGFLHGKVVDMLYFPIINTTWPQWVPWVGGEPFEFFRPVFNLADSAITTGMALLILGHKRYFAEAEATAAGAAPTSGADELQGEQNGQ